jgi:predicted lipoprotein
VRKQVAAILETADETAFDQRLAGKSVAVQGFSALDAVLYGPGSQDLEGSAAAESPRCRFTQSLARNIASIAKATSEDWTAGGNFENTWLQPSSANTMYLTPKETTQALLQSYVIGLELLRDTRLRGQLGLQKAGGKPLEQMFPNSGLALPYLQANIEGLKSLLSDGGFITRQAEPPITDPDKQIMTVLGSINDELTRAIENAVSAGKLSPTPFKDNAAREKLVAMGFPLKNAYATGGQTIADQASITMGFSALDGD